MRNLGYRFVRVHEPTWYDPVAHILSVGAVLVFLLLFWGGVYVVYRWIWH